MNEKIIGSGAVLFLVGISFFVVGYYAPNEFGELVSNFGSYLGFAGFIVMIAGTIPKKRETIFEEPKKDDTEEKMKLEKQQLEEIKNLLKKHRCLSEVEEKIKKWNEEGYNVEELEKMIEDIK